MSDTTTLSFTNAKDRQAIERRIAKAEEQHRQLVADLASYNANHLPPGETPITLADIDARLDAEERDASELHVAIGLLCQTVADAGSDKTQALAMAVDYVCCAIDDLATRRAREAAGLPPRTMKGQDQ